MFVLNSLKNEIPSLELKFSNKTTKLQNSKCVFASLYLLCFNREFFLDSTKRKNNFIVWDDSHALRTCTVRFNKRHTCYDCIIRLLFQMCFRFVLFFFTFCFTTLHSLLFRIVLNRGIWFYFKMKTKNHNLNKYATQHSQITS